MYQCVVPPRVFLASGLGLLIFSLVFGWISFSVPDWLQFHERNDTTTTKNVNISNVSNANDQQEQLANLMSRKFGLWYKCTFSIDLNDYVCTLWNNDAPSFVRVAQVLIPFGLSLGCFALLSACIGFMSTRVFNGATLFSALFAFLDFVFSTIGVTVFATEALGYMERFRAGDSYNSRRWGMWLIIPNLILAFVASICFTIAAILHWCDYRSMRVTGILSHSADKFGGSVFKAPSDSNMTAAVKKHHQYNHQQNQMPTQNYPNACYQIGGPNNNPNSMGYPPPPSYGAPMYQHGSDGTLNPAYQQNAGGGGPFGYSRPPSPPANPMFPHSNFDAYHPRQYMTENSEMEELPRTNRSRRRSRSRRHSSHRSRSRSPRESTTTGAVTSPNNANKQTQFIPIPIPYYQPQAPPPPPPPPAQAHLGSSNNNQPTSYVIQQQQPAPPQHYIQPSKQQFIEEFVQSGKPTNVLTYNTGQQPLLVSNATQPIYTIAYRANNGGGVLGSNILTGPPATAYVTAARTPFGHRFTPAGLLSIPNERIIEVDSSDGEDDDQNYRAMSRRHHTKKSAVNEAWTWRKL